MITRRQFSIGVTAAGIAMPWARKSAAQEPTGIDAVLAAIPRLHSIQVLVGDELVVAQAPRGGGLDRPANIKSCSKSIVALLLGTAIGRGEIGGVEARLGEVAPRLIPGQAQGGVAELTMEDLVTLRAGLEPTSGANYGQWIDSRNWVAHVLERRMIDRPGGRMIYSTGTTHVLGAALATATGQSLLELARQRLGAPLDIDLPPWTRDPQGFYLGGNEMALTPRAMLRVALLVRDKGRFNGEQVIAPEWIEQSMVVRTYSPFSGLGYGYGWFMAPSGYVLARGYGGQIIAAHPDRRLAVAITSNTDQPARSEGYFGELMDLLEGPVLALSA
jgi:CubicO group peptidase (beta-lactamase class C family)